MGRNCGWLTAATARAYRERLADKRFVPPALNLKPERKAIDALYVPELAIDIEAEGARLKAAMDRKGCVSVFVSEGANAAGIVEEMLHARRGGEARRLRPRAARQGQCRRMVLKRLTKLVGADRALVQKSGYFARSAAANAADRRLIGEMAEVAVASGLSGTPGLVGHDEANGDVLRAIELPRVKGGKPFDIDAKWFKDMLAEIGQPPGERVLVAHGGED